MYKVGGVGVVNKRRRKEKDNQLKSNWTLVFKSKSFFFLNLNQNCIFHVIRVIQHPRGYFNHAYFFSLFNPMKLQLYWHRQDRKSQYRKTGRNKRKRGWNKRKKGRNKRKISRLKIRERGAETRGRKAEIRGRKAETRRKAELRGRKAEIWGRGAETRNLDVCKTDTCSVHYRTIPYTCTSTSIHHLYCCMLCIHCLNRQMYATLVCI